MAQCVDIEESIPCLASRQHHNSIQTENSSDYFLLNLTTPLVNHLINEINLILIELVVFIYLYVHDKLQNGCEDPVEKLADMIFR